jgi:CheY-like chemotaxis protein
MNATLLIVDDLADNRAVLSRPLAKLGYCIREAENGAEAVSRCLIERPDVIIMDISMPEMDGIEALRTLHEMCENPPPAIALTATRVRDIQWTCAEVGFRAYLEKPCTMSNLTQVVEQCLAEAAGSSACKFTNCQRHCSGLNRP